MTISMFTLCNCQIKYILLIEKINWGPIDEDVGSFMIMAAVQTTSISDKLLTAKTGKISNL